MAGEMILSVKTACGEWVLPRNDIIKSIAKRTHYQREAWRGRENAQVYAGLYGVSLDMARRILAGEAPRSLPAPEAPEKPCGSAAHIVIPRRGGRPPHRTEVNAADLAVVKHSLEAARDHFKVPPYQLLDRGRAPSYAERARTMVLGIIHDRLNQGEDALAQGSIGALLNGRTGQTIARATYMHRDNMAHEDYARDVATLQQEIDRRLGC